MIYKWYYDLRENTMTRDVKEDYVAVPRRVLTLNVHSISERIAKKRTEYRVETIENIANMYEQEVMEAVAEGNSYVSNLIRIQPSICGVFGAKGTLDVSVNYAQVNITPAPKFVTLLNNVELEYSGRRLILGGAEISEVEDVATGYTDGRVTRGGGQRPAERVEDQMFECRWYGYWPGYADQQQRRGNGNYRAGY